MRDLLILLKYHKWLFVHILQLSLHRLWLDLYFEDRLVVDVVVLSNNVGVHHLVVDDTESGRVAARLVTSLPPEGGVGDAVVEAGWFILSLQFIVGVGQTVTVWRQPQSQLVLRDGQLD